MDTIHPLLIIQTNQSRATRTGNNLPQITTELIGDGTTEVVDCSGLVGTETIAIIS